MKTARPFHVSTFGLSPDMQRVHPAFGTLNRGEVSRRTLTEVLELYRKIESDWPSSASHMAIQSDTGRFIVRVSGHQLTLAIEGEPGAQAAPLAAAEIVARLEQPPAPLALGPPPAPPEPRWRIGLSAALFVAGVAVMVYALGPVLAPARVAADAEVAFLTDEADVAAQQRTLVGVFATGQRPGDRNLTISSGQIVFAELGPRHGLVSRADSFRLGSRDERTCLVTARNGVIEVINSNTLLYYGDLYRRLE